MWRPTATPRRLTVVAVVAAGLLVTSCSSDDTRVASATTLAPAATGATSATTLPDPPGRSYVAIAHAGVNPVPVFSGPGGQPLVETQPDGSTRPLWPSNPNDYGAPATFLIRQRGVTDPSGTWHEVYLPIRPNSSVGWVRDGDVDIRFVDYRVVVRLGAFRLDLFHNDTKVATYPIALGTAANETPPGLFYLTALVVPDQPAYGTYAYGLSAYSSTIKDDPRFGDGQIGIHGTDQPELIGQRVSHGCIRLTNPDIDDLVGHDLPLGTPVEVQP